MDRAQVFGRLRFKFDNTVGQGKRADLNILEVALRCELLQVGSHWLVSSSEGCKIVAGGRQTPGTR